MNIPKKNDLDGFVLFTETKGTSFDTSVAVIVTESNARLTQGAAKCLNGAEYINIFFDESGRRMMLRKAEKTNANIFRLNGGKNLLSIAVRKQIRTIAGIADIASWSGIRFEGYQPTPSAVIFDLSKSTIVQFSKGKKK